MIGERCIIYTVDLLNPSKVCIGSSCLGFAGVQASTPGLTMVCQP